MYNILSIGKANVMTLTLGSWPKQGHGKVKAKKSTRESYLHFWEYGRMWGNESTHSQVDSHFGELESYELPNF